LVPVLVTVAKVAAHIALAEAASVLKVDALMVPVLTAVTLAPIDRRLSALPTPVVPVKVLEMVPALDAIDTSDVPKTPLLLPELLVPAMSPVRALEVTEIPPVL
jgi:hypothetical protein